MKQRFGIPEYWLHIVVNNITMIIIIIIIVRHRNYCDSSGVGASIRMKKSRRRIKNNNITTILCVTKRYRIFIEGYEWKKKNTLSVHLIFFVARQYIRLKKRLYMMNRLVSELRCFFVRSISNVYLSDYTSSMGDIKNVVLHTWEMATYRKRIEYCFGC